ncbi:unnamed protein product [Vitrella brassicaformis CCMP3155]|uniref:Amino acid permease/ SLC12A domain-containing protein n=2 Tax=Vitrella brassicaformis TaxID=1169539 RepID=A0A0G4F4Y1_VITBC|nr:unnamed protein product [Vitrella brassicaformis CCMP3155]|eukprot:CEM06777.1 unnamed protein product [Vitrella brassicaformis CCMP3155]
MRSCDIESDAALSLSPLHAPSSHSSSTTYTACSLSDGHGNAAKTTAGASSWAQSKLGILGLLGLAFFSVSGGVYGSEMLVRSLGLPLAIGGQLAMCVLYAFPYSLVCLELSLMMPHNGGPMVWARYGLGPLSGFLTGIIYLAYECTVLGSYSSCSVGYLSKWVPMFGTDERFETAFNFTIMFLGLFICTLKIDQIGSVFVCLTVGAILPFVIILLWAPVAVSPVAFMSIPKYPHQMQLFAGITTLIWCNSGYHSALTRVEDNSDLRNVPTAMLVNCIVVSISYVLPLWAGAAVLPTYIAWTDGYFVEVARAIGGGLFGVVLGRLVIAGSVISALGQFVGDLTTSCEFVACMADHGYLPSFLAERTSNQQPVRAMVALFVFAMACSIFLKFTSLTSISSLSYAATNVIVYAAFLHLRWTRPDLGRACWVPIRSFWGCVAFCAPGVLISLLPCFLAIWYSWSYEVVPSIALGCLVIVTILAPFSLSHVKRKEQFLHFYTSQSSHVSHSHPTYCSIDVSVPREDVLTPTTVSSASSSTTSTTTSSRGSGSPGKETDKESGGRQILGWASLSRSRELTDKAEWLPSILAEGEGGRHHGAGKKR